MEWEINVNPFCSSDYVTRKYRKMYWLDIHSSPKVEGDERLTLIKAIENLQILGWCDHPSNAFPAKCMKCLDTCLIYQNIECLRSKISQITSGKMLQVNSRLNTLWCWNQLEPKPRAFFEYDHYSRSTVFLLKLPFQMSMSISRLEDHTGSLW